MALSVLPNTVGILGGAFNPAHDGHLHISQWAKELLHLDAIWWIVAHDHPTKSLPSSKNFSERFKQATTLVKGHPFITISDFEKNSNTRYTVDTLHLLCKTYPKINFIYLMGADNFSTLHTWYKWQEILDYSPIAIIDRGSDKQAALTSPFATYFAHRSIKNPEDLIKTIPYGWCFLNTPKHPGASTDLRSKLVLKK